MTFKNPLDKLGQQMFLEALTKPRIVTANGATVTYAFELPKDAPMQTLSQLFDAQSTDAKIAEILTQNPDFDFLPLQEPLRIKIINVQRKAAAAQDKPPRPRILT